MGSKGRQRCKTTGICQVLVIHLYLFYIVHALHSTRGPEQSAARNRYSSSSTIIGSSIHAATANTYSMLPLAVSKTHARCNATGK